MADETTTTTPTAEPENFSPASARLAIEALFNALPKSRRLDYIGELNEAMVVLDRLGSAGGRDPLKAV